MGERSKPYVRPISIRLAANVALAIGLVGPVAAVSVVVGAVRHTGGVVTVPAHYDVLPTVLAEPVEPAPGLPAGSDTVTTAFEQSLRVPGSTFVEQLLAVGDVVLIGLAVGIGAVLLRGLLMAIAAGQPFERRNARRLAGIAGLILVAGLLGPALPDIAGILVLDRVGAIDPDSRYAASVSFPLIPLLVVPPLLALAEAFRRGAELADDVSGLV